MKKLYRLIAGFRCPNCNNLFPILPALRTATFYPGRWWNDTYECEICGSKSRIKDSRISIFLKSMLGFLFVFVTNISAMILLDKVGFPLDSFIGFILYAIFFFYPSALLPDRLFKMKVVE
jgi:Zn ribbon nucleic-acid-binding protein